MNIFETRDKTNPSVEGILANFNLEVLFYQPTDERIDTFVPALTASLETETTPGGKKYVKIGVVPVSWEVQVYMVNQYSHMVYTGRLVTKVEMEGERETKNK
jgi:hypothetical protein